MSVRTLAIAGSLRATSSNTALIRAATSLIDTLTTMTARMVPEASSTVAVSGRLKEAREIGEDPVVAPALRAALMSVAAVVV